MTLSQEPQIAFPLLNDFQRPHEVRTSGLQRDATGHRLRVDIESAVPQHSGLRQPENDAALSDERARSVPQEIDSIAQDLARIQTQARELLEKQRARRREMAAQRLETFLAEAARVQPNVLGGYWHRRHKFVGGQIRLGVRRAVVVFPLF